MRYSRFVAIIVLTLIGCSQIDPSPSISSEELSTFDVTSIPIPTLNISASSPEPTRDLGSLFSDVLYLGDRRIEASALSSDNTFVAIGNLEGVALYQLDPVRELWFQPVGRTSIVMWRDKNQSFITLTGDILTAWDAASGTAISEVKLPFAPYADPSFSPNGALLAGRESQNDKIYVWNTTTGEQTLVLDVGSAGALTWSSDSTLIQAGSSIWDVSTGTSVQNLASGEARGGFYYTSSGAFSPDGTLFASGHFAPGADYDLLEPYGGGGLIGIFNVLTGELVTSWSPGDGVRHVVFGPDGQELGYSLYGFSPVIFRSIATGEVTRVIEETGALAFSQDGSLLAITSPDAVTIVNAQTGQQEYLIGGYTFGSTKVEFSPDGYMIASNSATRVNIWDAHTGQWLRSLSPASPETDLSWSPSTPLVAVGLANPAIWNAETGEQLFTLDAGYSRMYPHSLIAFSPQGNLLAATSGDFAGYDFYDGDVYWGPSSMTFYGDGDRILLWDPSTGLLVRELLTGGGIAAMAWSSDGSRLATYTRVFSSDGVNPQLQVWDVTSGTIISSFSPEFSPEMYDNETMVSQPNGNAIVGIERGSVPALWSLETGQKIQNMSGGDIPYGMDFSSDGRYLAGGAGDSIFIWEVSTGKLVASHTFDLNEAFHYDFISDVAFSPDGKQLAAAAQGKIIVVSLGW